MHSSGLREGGLGWGTPTPTESLCVPVAIPGLEFGLQKLSSSKITQALASARARGMDGGLVPRQNQDAPRSSSSLASRDLLFFLLSRASSARAVGDTTSRRAVLGGRGRDEAA